MKLAWLLLLFLSGSVFCHAETPIQIPASVGIDHFAEVDKGVFGGSKPHTDKDFEFLQSEHIKYILNVHFLPFLSGAEKHKARRYGMKFISLPMNASPVSPSEKHVDKILATLRDSELHPIYFHCVLGRDRTSLISGLYKIYFLGVSPKDAWQEMRESDFKTWFFTRGLTVYFNRHASRPPAAFVRK